MATVTLSYFANLLAKQFINLINYPVSGNSLYMFIGREIPWPDDTNPPTPGDTPNQFKNSWDFMMGGKLITSNDVSLVIPRVNWASNTIYTAYTDTNTNLYNTRFYVLNANNELYKCLANNNGGLSTVQPSGLGTSSNNYIQTLSDGYVWKYMLDIGNGDKFINNFYVPVPYIAPTNSNQYLIEQAAVPGSIDIINVTSGGTGYANSPNSYIVTITGDGIGANAYANVANNSVQNIVMVNRGSGYSYATVSFGGIGSGASATAIMPPVGGHGSAADLELDAKTIMISTQLSGNESGYFTVTNSFREVGLILNPTQYIANTISANSLIKTYTTLSVSSGIGNYNPSETVYQGPNLAQATYQGIVIDFDSNQNVLKMNDIIGAPQLNNILYGQNTGAQRYIVSVSNPDVNKYTGNFIEISDVGPVSRTITQLETYKFILAL